MSSNTGTQQSGTQAFHKDAAKEASSTSKNTRRVLRKIQKAPLPIKEYAWLGGHAATLVFGAFYLIIYVLSFFGFFKGWYWIPKILYTLAFIGVIVSYTITIITTFGKIVPSYHTLFSTLNFQNLTLAGVWLITRMSAFKLIPYYLVALLQIADFKKIGFIMKFEKKITDAIAFFELYVFVSLIFDTLLFRLTSGFAFVIYASFYWIRLNFSPYTQVYILRIAHFIDDKIMKKQKPEIQAKWKNFKDFLEYRRQVMAETLAKKQLDHEAETEPVDHSKSQSKPLGDSTKNYQLQGQTIDPSQLTKGVIVTEEYEIEAKKNQKLKEAEKAQNFQDNLEQKVAVTKEESKDKLEDIKRKSQANIAAQTQGSA